MVWLDGETHDPLHVDVTVRDWRDMRQMLSWVAGDTGGPLNCSAVSWMSVNAAIGLPRSSSDNAV